MIKEDGYVVSLQHNHGVRPNFYSNSLSNVVAGLGRLHFKVLYTLESELLWSSACIN